MQNFGARIIQVETKAVVALSRGDLGALFLNIGKGRPFDEETPSIVNAISEHGLRKGRESCPEGKDNCAMAKATHMLEQNGVKSKDGESAAQISYRCSACINLIGLEAAASATAIDIQGTVSRGTSS